MKLKEIKPNGIGTVECVIVTIKKDETEITVHF